MVEKNCKCPVCGIDAIERGITERFANMYYCERCGKYIIDEHIAGMFSDASKGPQLKGSLFWYFRISKNFERRNQHIPYICPDDWNDGSEGNYQFITIKNIVSMFPDTLGDRINKILCNISSLVGVVGGEIKIDLDNGREYYPTFLIDIDYESLLAEKQFDEILSILVENDFLKETEVLGNGEVLYTLKPRGWDKVKELESKMATTPKAFVAMWFDESMKKAREEICRAISTCGYLPVLIDEKEHNSFIVPEILYEIQQSRFVVSDFTGNRGGVYFEAGYAKGLQKEVIMTCKDGEFDPHFDIKQINHIVWKNEEDLYERLVKRIEATVGMY